MSGHEYLLGVLDGQKMGDAEVAALQRLRGEIEGVLRKTFGTVPRFYYGGSYGKHRMIRASYDLDIVMYFPSTDNRTLKQLYSGAYHVLKQAGYTIQPKTVALQLPYQGGFHVDVVPGKAQDATYYWATLFKNTTPDSTMRTSIKKHIDTVSDNGCREIIKLMKLWRVRHGLQWKSIALEQTVIGAMFQKQRGDLGVAIWENVLPFIRGNVLTVRLVDPANSSNVFQMSRGERVALQQAATESLKQKNWNQVIW